MIALIGALPGASLDSLVEEHASAGPVERWHPLAAPPWLARVPGRVGAFARRRVAVAEVSAPPLLALHAALRGWARDHTDRRYEAEFITRLAIDAWAAREVARRRPQVVIASSLASRRTFSVARSIGAKTVLVLDVPLLRALHRDLDRAASVWPERAFLRRYRAPSWVIARQEAERILADQIVVRGVYARELCIADGIAATRISLLAPPQAPPMARPRARTNRIRLAGLAAARHGIDTALAAARMLGVTLVVRTGEGSEPADLLARRDVASDAGPVDAIVCPAICETYAAELTTADLPAIASPMASHDGAGPDPFDAEAFAAAIERALAQGHVCTR